MSARAEISGLNNKKGPSKHYHLQPCEATKKHPAAQYLRGLQPIRRPAAQASPAWLPGQRSTLELTPARAVFPTPRLPAKGVDFSSPLRAAPGGPGWALAARFYCAEYLRNPAMAWPLMGLSGALDECRILPAFAFGVILVRAGT